MNLLRREISGIGDQDAERDLDRAIVDPALDVVDDPADEQAQCNAAGGEPGEGQDAARHSRHLLVDHNGGGELKSEQAGSVVDEALSFENVHDAARQPDAPGDGSGGNGVCRGDNGAEHEAEAPVKTGENCGRNQGDGYNRESDQAEGEEKDADQVVPKVAPGSGPGSGIEQRRENDQKDKIGIEGDVRACRE